MIFRPFGVWLHSPRDRPQCRSVRHHELNQLIGVDEVHPMHEFLPYEEQMEVLSAVPGRHGLAAVFFAVLTAKIPTSKSAMINPRLRSSASGKAALSTNHHH